MTDLQDNSYWNATAGEPPVFPALEGDLEADIVIVGGGIVGVTTARLLKDQGQKVALVEARRVGREVTGKSTAKITSQHGIRYQVLERKFGEEKARLYGEAQQAGLARIQALAAEHGIDADIEEKPAYLYTRDKDYVEQIEKEAEAAKALGLPATLTTDTGLPFDVLATLRFDRQAQFHPTRYVAGLARTIPGDGCHLFEQSRAVDYEPDRVVTDRGTIRARHVVMATHLPLGQIGLYYARNEPIAEPAIAARIPRDLPGMYKNVEQPSHSIRTHKGADGQIWAICAGTHFKPGHAEDERRHMEDISRWLAENFGASKPDYRWVNEDYTPMDERAVHRLVRLEQRLSGRDRVRRLGHHQRHRRCDDHRRSRRGSRESLGRGLRRDPREAARRRAAIRQGQCRGGDGDGGRLAVEKGDILRYARARRGGDPEGGR